jgi:hypothetical protein
MAGQTRRSTRGQGRSSRDDSSRPVLVAASVAGSGSVIDTASPASSPAVITKLATRATYRTLIMRGMAPEEAANLTAFMAGIPIGQGHWTLKQINELLFLRRMHETGKLSDREVVGPVI